ncbi:MaoC family dehydratase [Neorhizobium petrolearium]|uniref:MaoC family dehydratase n=1 Tax=Neorhizobium petrolearium TaxID=515361 RepID=A0ABY8MAT6_9HYPH|nr:MaoC family dehydratase [Neorhizobium petrolearium]MCC2610673.1 MaoC family dehydratase [Neorhizobium petrolearium]WGI70804.1 MaoC family dehydratase [Neorhizobium petrolearium]
MRLIELSPPGRKIITGTLAFTAEDIIRFAKKFDPQPFHVDADAARDYVFGGLCASGWHTCAGWMKTYIAYWTKEAARLESEGISPPKLGPSAGFKKLQWLKPVYAGDSITYSISVTESRPLASRPGTWINMTVNDGVNQHGDVVMRYEGTVLEFD